VIYAAPRLTQADGLALNKIDQLRDELRFYLAEPRRWYGTLRRAALARAVQGSNSIEGYHASVEDVAAVIEDEEPLEATGETVQAIAGYRDAMTFVIQRAPSSPTVDVTLLQSLHFMMMKHDLSKHPGRWRPGAVWVSNADDGVVNEAPHRDLVEPLIEELIEQLASAEGPAMVTAAMAHLNLTLIHPFSDGNGRMARCLQTLVLASDGVLAPEFCSIEEYLGRNTAAYYEALSAVSGGVWSPHRSAGAWIQFCLTAHYRQAQRTLARIRETEALWDRCEQAAARHRLPSRVVGALCDAARGRRLRRSLYLKITRSSSGEPLSGPLATRDLAAMASAGLLKPVGATRGRYYLPTAQLRGYWIEVRSMRPSRPPDKLYETASQPHLPGVT